MNQRNDGVEKKGLSGYIQWYFYTVEAFDPKISEALPWRKQTSEFKDPCWTFHHYGKGDILITSLITDRTVILWIAFFFSMSSLGDRWLSREQCQNHPSLLINNYKKTYPVGMSSFIYQCLTQWFPTILKVGPKIHKINGKKYENICRPSVWPFHRSFSCRIWWLSLSRLWHYDD